METNYLNNVDAIVEAVAQQWAAIEERVGSEWTDLERQLLSVLDDLAKAQDEARAKELVTELLFIGYYTPANSIFKKIMGDYPPDEGGLVEVSRGEKGIEELPVSMGIEKGMTLVSLKANVAETVAQLQAMSSSENDSNAQSRYLNAGFFTESGQYVEPDIPLALDQAPYQLGVNIGAFWGPGAANLPFPPLPDDLYESDDTLSLDVFARTQDEKLKIGTPQKTLILPKSGNSETLLFELQIGGNDRYTIDVDVFYHGHLLQSRRTEFKVVQEAGEELPPSAWPVQDGYITFTRTTQLTREALAPLAQTPRRLILLVERDASQQNIGIRIYDNSGDSLTLHPTKLNDQNLTPILDGLRRRLLDVMNAYQGTIGDSEAFLAINLGKLASGGRTFFRALFPDLRDGNGLGNQMQTALQYGDVIQVAPLSEQVSIPWELVYERPIDPQEHHSKLCATFREHGPNREDCPHHDDPTIVCPHGFWGYRYIIEQLPDRVASGVTPSEKELSFLIPNNHPLHLSALIYNTPGFPQHWKNLRGLAPEGQVQLRQVKSWEEAKSFFTNRMATANIVYFYTHSGKDDMGQPYLQISDDYKLTMNSFDAWNVNWQQMQPLVILNACESANYNPNDYENLLLFFSQRGAKGAIGTQCEVKELLADAFIIRFFTHFFQQMSAGEALFTTRRQLLYEHLDPRGLVYSLFAAAEVKLAQPVFNPEV